MQTPMTSPMISSLHHWHRLVKPMKGATQHLLGFISVSPSSGEVLMYMQGLMCWHTQHFWSLLPSKIIDWVVVCYCHECPHCMDVFTHSRSVLWVSPFCLLAPFCRISLPSVGAHVCTVIIVMFIRLHHRKCLATRGDTLPPHVLATLHICT